MTTGRNQYIEIKPPLPCGILRPTEADPDARCGQPAQVGLARPVPPYNVSNPFFATISLLAGPGEWIILPVCRTCAQDAEAIYTEDKNARP